MLSVKSKKDRQYTGQKKTIKGKSMFYKTLTQETENWANTNPIKNRGGLNSTKVEVVPGPLMFCLHRLDNISSLGTTQSTYEIQQFVISTCCQKNIPPLCITNNGSIYLLADIQCPSASSSSSQCFGTEMVYSISLFSNLLFLNNMY